MITRKWLVPAAGLGLGLLAAALYRPRQVMRWLAQSTGDVLFMVPTEQKIVALTIDDGPHPGLTPAILDELRRHGARATFFLLGERVPGNERIVQRIVDEGHEIGNHLMEDEPSIRLPAGEFERQLDACHDLLACYAPVRWCRPGSGWYNRRMLEQLRASGYRCVVGSVYPYDAQIPFAWFHSLYILMYTFPGAIITLHDGSWDRGSTVKVLRNTLPRLRARGYTVGTVSELVAAGS